ncbi:hypothetical protein BSKO_12011 [Bryopsis sp. KO-2023]|nr:hypothetical protein BSKO_12011 [Bryopsis sp. KO-2023]
MVRFTSLVVGGILLALAVVGNVSCADPGMDKDMANAAVSVKRVSLDVTILLFDLSAFQKEPSLNLSGRKLRQTRDQEEGSARLAKKTDVNAPIQVGEVTATPLEIAVIFRRSDLIPVLVKAGANPNLISRDTTPLGGAIAFGDVATVKTLLKNGADPELKNPIITAVLLGEARIVTLLIRAGVDPNDKKLKIGRFPLLHTASAFGKLDVVDALVAGGADTSVRVDGFDYKGVRCLCLASEDADIEELCTSC